jgi:hypothetical protein
MGQRCGVGRRDETGEGPKAGVAPGPAVIRTGTVPAALWRTAAPGGMLCRWAYGSSATGR